MWDGRTAVRPYRGMTSVSDVGAYRCTPSNGRDELRSFLRWMILTQGEPNLLVGESFHAVEGPFPFLGETDE